MSGTVTLSWRRASGFRSGRPRRHRRTTRLSATHIVKSFVVSDLRFARSKAESARTCLFPLPHVSNHTTSTRIPGIPSFDVGYSYTSFGDVASVSYPRFYDASGNQLHWGSLAYEWDDFNTLKTLQGQGNHRTYLYTADDERVWTSSFTSADSPDTWTFTLRGLDNKVLTTYEAAGNAPNSWTWKQDYVYRNGLLQATEHADGKRSYFSLDHLGTPRLLTDNNNAIQSLHHYFGFGEEIGVDPIGETMKFTGHERDFNSGSGTGDDLDYMHARYCNPNLGRFLSVDPKARRKPLKMSQLWGRYSYSIGNPLKFIDPDGEDLKIVYDFSRSNLPNQAQVRIASGVAGAFRRAGVKNVQVFFEGSGLSPTKKQKSDRIVKLTFSAKEIKSPTGKPVYGVTGFLDNEAVVSTASAPEGDSGETFLINVGAHEAGHASGALNQYAFDADPSLSLYRAAEPGTVMESHLSPEEFAAFLRNFSQEDASSLQEALNEPEPE